MKKKLALLALIFWVSAQAMEFDHLYAPKIGSKAFTLIPPYDRLISKSPPNIGVYGPGYPMLARIGLIQLAPKMITNWLPNELRRLLPTAHVPDIIFNVEIDRGAPKTYNMVFHPWAGTWQNKKLFNINVPMGLFAVNGVQPASSNSIPFNTLIPQNVHVHNEGNALAYSPNNARFTVTPNRTISTFWSAAFSPDKQHGIVTFHILANNDQAEKIIVDSLESAQTIGEFLRALERNSNTLAQQVDRQALQEAINTIEVLVGNKPAIIPPIVKAEVHVLSENLRTLTTRLQALHKSFEQKR